MVVVAVVVVVVVYLSISLSLSIYLSIYLSICKLAKEAILRDFLNVLTWQRQKRSYSARLPQFSKLTTSKTKQVCEVECRADGLVPMRFVIFPFHLSKVLRLPRKSDARSFAVLRLSRKIILANLKIWCSKMQGNQRCDLLTSLLTMSLLLGLPREMHLCGSSSNVPRLPSFLEMPGNPHVLFTFDKVHNPLRRPCETTSEPPKVVRNPGAFNLLTSKCASRHNGVHFFDIATSKRALQKCSAHGVLCTFWLGNVLCTTTAYTFSTSQLPKVLWLWCVLCILTWQCASRHNGVQFSTSQLPKVVWDRQFFTLLTLKMCFVPQPRATFHLSSGQMDPHLPL